MLTGMSEDDWALALRVFAACQSRRGDKGRDYRSFLEAMHFFTVENVSWRRLPERFDKPYRSGLSRDRLKTKCVAEDIFVVTGFQPGTGAVRAPFANINLARFDRERLRYTGVVGTGFSERVAAALRKQLDRIVGARCLISGLKIGGAVWVLPDLRARIAYRGTTTSGELRHASFKGLEV